MPHTPVPVQRYARAPHQVEAARMVDDETHAIALAQWAGGIVDRDRQTGKLLIRLPQSKIPATPGVWIVRDVMPDGLGPARTMLDSVFVWAFPGGHDPAR